MQPLTPAAPKTRAVILHGASDIEDRPDEADVLVQAEFITGILSTLGYAVSLLPVRNEMNVLQAVLEQDPALIFNLVEGLEGDGRLIHRVPALLESAGKRFTGCSAEAMILSTDKLLAKWVMRANGIPTPDWSASGEDLPAGSQAIVKSVFEDASFGLDAGSIVSAAHGGLELSRRKTQFGGEWFAEAYIEGREFNLSILERADGPKVLPVAEIDFSSLPLGVPHIVDYEAKWDEEAPSYSLTGRGFSFAAADQPLLAQLRNLALDCWRVFCLSGYARVDFRVDRNGNPFVLEVNANPCLSPDAGFMAAAKEAGLSETDAIGAIIDAAVGRVRAAA